MVQEEGRAIGFVDLYDISLKDRRAYVGIMILPSFGHQGYGLAALAELETYAFNALNITSLFVHIDVQNQPSEALFRHAGYEIVGTLPDYIIRAGKPLTLHILYKSLRPR